MHFHGRPRPNALQHGVARFAGQFASAHLAAQEFRLVKGKPLPAFAFHGSRRRDIIVHTRNSDGTGGIFTFGQQLDVRRNVIQARQSRPVTDANLDCRHIVQSVQVCHREIIDPVDDGRVSAGDGVEPSTAPRTARGSAELPSHGMEHVGDLGALRWQRPFAHACGVGLHDPDHAIHPMGGHA